MLGLRRTGSRDKMIIVVRRLTLDFPSGRDDPCAFQAIYSATLFLKPRDGQPRRWAMPDFPLVRPGILTILRLERPGKKTLTTWSDPGKKSLRLGAPREKKLRLGAPRENV